MDGVPRSIGIYCGEALLGSVTAPVAYDADGLNVPVRAEIEDGAIAVHVEHDKRSYRWPVHVDPIVGDGQSAWIGDQYDFGAEWVFRQYGYNQYPGNNYYGSTKNSATYGYGLVIAMPHNSMFDRGIELAPR